MLKISALALGLATLAATGAVAQTVEIGPNGPSLDLRSRGQRERDYDREQARRERDYDREQARRDRDYDRRATRDGAYDRDLSTGNTRCRTTTVRERDDDGRLVTRETRTCR